MKNSHLFSGILVAAVAMAVTACSTEEAFNPERTERFSLSASDGSVYTMQVALPADYDGIRTYTTLYVLDGDENFGFVANHSQEISEELSVSNVIVVAIGYGHDRSLDYTPTKTGSGTGGAPQFLEFITRQLVPEVEKRYSADTTRTGRIILGHSYGGLFGAYAFAADNNVFGNYLLLSPSLWYDNEVTFYMEEAGRSAIQSREQLIFLGQGEQENSGRMQAPFEAFYQILTKNYTALRVAKHLEQDLDHMGSRNPNILHALRFYFENQVH